MSEDGPAHRCCHEADDRIPMNPPRQAPHHRALRLSWGHPRQTQCSGSSPAARIRSSRSSGAWETATILAPSGLHAIYVKVRLYGSSGKIAVAESPGFHLAKSILRVTDVNALRGRTI